MWFKIVREKHIRNKCGPHTWWQPQCFSPVSIQIYLGYYSNQSISYSSSSFAFSRMLGLPYNQVLLKLFRSLAVCSLTFHGDHLVLSPQNLFVTKHFKHTKFNSTFRQWFLLLIFLVSLLVIVLKIECVASLTSNGQTFVISVRIIFKIKSDHLRNILEMWLRLYFHKLPEVTHKHLDSSTTAR